MQRTGELLLALLSSRKEGDDRLAMYVVCDLLEHVGPESEQAWPQFMPKLLQGVTNYKDHELRQAAAYGVHMAAKIPAFAQAAPEAAAAVVKAIKDKKAKKKDCRDATDNLVAALGGLCEHQAGVDQSLWKLWLDSLPLTNDEGEGQKTHAQLLRLCVQQHPVISTQPNLQRSLEVLALVYKTDGATDELNQGVRQLFLQAGAQLESLMHCW